MKKIIFLLVFIFVLSNTVLAHGEEAFAKAEEIIESRIPCNELADDQLEIIGDYYMEQMHPGEAHEVMDEMMGGEGSERLRQMHINMAKSFYCGEHDAMSSGMMNRMMGQGMMGSSDLQNKGGMMNMMGSYGAMGAVGLYGLLFWAIVALIFSLIFWGVYRLFKKGNK